MGFIVKVKKDGTIKIPKIKNAEYVKITIERVRIDPSVAANLPEIFGT